MIKPTFLVSEKDGKPTVELVTLNVDEALEAYKNSDKDVYLFVKPVYTKRKRALKKPKSEEQPKPATKQGKAK